MNTFTIDNETESDYPARFSGSGRNSSGFRTIHNSGRTAGIERELVHRALDTDLEHLPGNAPVKKFTDRKTAVSRIWKALQVLEAPFVNETIPEHGADSIEGDDSIAEYATQEGSDLSVAEVEECPLLPDEPGSDSDQAAQAQLPSNPRPSLANRRPTLRLLNRLRVRRPCARRRRTRAKRRPKPPVTAARLRRLSN